MQNDLIIFIGRVLETLGFDSNIKEMRNLSGGCIHQVFKIKTGQSDYVIKLNVPGFEKMFKTEAHGLELLRKQQFFHIPEVFSVGNSTEYSYLLLEYISPGSRAPDFWKDFASNLAKLHKISNPQFGLETDNFIGSLPQRNSPDKDWIRFFVENRLQFQLELAGDKVDAATRNKFDQLYNKLGSVLNSDVPSLLHGDLWTGNFLVNNRGGAALIDPAVYFGNREIELAFTQLFGGFDEEFYTSYKEIFPLSPGYEERFEIYNLYPLLVHVNLFGGGYINNVKAILNRFT